MKKEISAFFSALMLLTRLPLPRYIQVRHDSEHSARYFPLVGIIVGVFSAVSFLLAHLTFSMEVSLLCSLIVSIFLTGGLHEDGFADSCDGFGGGWTKEKILAIMKDSRLGSYGTLGLILMLATKLALMRELIQSFPKKEFSSLLIICSLVAAHALSRFMTVFTIRQSTYVYQGEKSKVGSLVPDHLGWGELFAALVIALLPFLELPPLFLVIIIPVWLTTYLMMGYFEKWIGGYTGDCLGAIQQVTEIVCYGFFIVLWKYT